MANLSEQKREKMLQILDALKAQHKDEETIIAINEIKNEINSKKYGLVWEQHEENVDIQMKTHVPVFTEVKDREINANPSDEKYNFILEGDNLHSLKLLEKTHRGKIDVIYIDPPYNTLNKDFVYDDLLIGKEDGYRHSKWISFMYERLKIAQELLSEEGCIFISIDDNEQANLKLLCDEIFGEEKFVALIPWRKRTAKSDVPHGISQDYESILCYANNGYQAAIKGKERKYFETEDYPGREWRFHDLTTQRTVEERPNSNYTMVNPRNGDEYPVNPLRCWAITKDTFQQYYDEGRVIFPGDYDFLKISKPVLRYWKDEDKKKAGSDFGLTAVSTQLPQEVGMSQDGTKEITALFGTKQFSYPKPLSLIKYLVQISTIRKDDATILDFFAGSGTTGQAVLELNNEDEGYRHFILCTNNESSICEKITYPRIKISITGKRLDNSDYSEGIPANLKYFKTDFIAKSSDDEFYSVEEQLSNHIKEMIELENGISIDNEKYIMILTDEEADELEKTPERIKKCERIYVSGEVLLTQKQENLFNDKDIITIPQYYFEDELMEVGEL